MKGTRALLEEVRLAHDQDTAKTGLVPTDSD